jgi:hypothetical protein
VTSDHARVCRVLRGLHPKSLEFSFDLDELRPHRVLRGPQGKSDEKRQYDGELRA